MQCPKCNSKLPENAKFCLECGSNISGISLSDFKTVDPGINTFQASEQKRAVKDISLSDYKTVENIADPKAIRKDDISLSDVKTLNQGEMFDTATTGDIIAGRYEIIEKIGEGGFGVVFKAKDEKLGNRIVAVKRLLSKYTSGEETKTVIQRFLQEASSIASLNHRNIVTVYDSGSKKNDYYISMEYIDGGTLKDYLEEKNGLEFEEAITLFKGIAQGLSYAHRKNIIHRDIKPANIMLQNEDGVITPKILDFGLARMGVGSELSMTGYGMGTPAYMPPEQRRDAKNVNHTADIYALGKILYELITGEIPDNIDQQMIPPPPELANIIFKCLKTKPEDRYFSVDDILRDLSVISEQLPVSSEQLAVSGQQLAVGNKCPACNYENDKNIKFCEGCGNGLTRKCPECETETNINIKYCKDCGTAIETFIQVQDILQKIKGYYNNQKWSRVIKESELLPENAKNVKQKAKENIRKIHNYTEAAKENIKTIAKLKNDIEPTIKEGNLEYALQLLNNYLKLDNNNEYRKLRDEIQLEFNAQLEELRIADEIRQKEKQQRAEKNRIAEEKRVEEERQKIAKQKQTKIFIFVIVVVLLGVFIFTGIKINNYMNYSNFIAKAEFAESKKDWQKANEFYKQALTVNGYEDDKIALTGMKEAMASKYKQEYNNYITKAKFAESTKDWIKANEFYKQALTVNGYEDDTIALKGKLRSVKAKAEEIARIAKAKADEIARIAKAKTDEIARIAKANRIAEEKRLAQVAEKTASYAITQANAHFANAKNTSNAILQRRSSANKALSLLNETHQSHSSYMSHSLKLKLTLLTSEIAEYSKKQLYFGPKQNNNWTIPKIGMQFAFIASGSFQMGSNEQSDEKPIHRVTISKNFWLGKYEVKQAEYESIMGNNPSRFKGSNNPVVTVSWSAAVKFCQKLTDRERTAGRLPAGYSYRLPTEAEWEYAARGGNKSRGYKYSGSNSLSSVAWFLDNSGRKTHAVGGKQANELGLYDMSGNVYEWCNDWYDSGYYANSPSIDPKGSSSGFYRVNRGGSWRNDASRCRSANRSYNSPTYTYILGFRVCLGL